MRITGARRQQIHSLSRNRSFLLRLAAAILGIAFVLAFATSNARKAFEVVLEPRSPLISLELALTRESATAESIADQLRGLNNFAAPAEETGSIDTEGAAFPEGLNLTTLEDFLANSPIDSSHRQLFVAYLNARYARDDLQEEGRRYLETHARMAPPVRFANEFSGDLLYARNEVESSLEHYEAEAAAFESTHARKRILEILLLTENASKLRPIAHRESYRNVASGSQKIRIAILLKDWSGLLADVIAFEIETMRTPEVLLSLFAAFIWFLIIIQAAHFTRTRLLSYIAGLLAGIVSATATLYILILQENVGGMSPGGDWIEEVIYFITGVALREEVVKLALFALLVPLLWKRGSALEAFLAASCVGLGFALQENVNYYTHQGNTAAVGRFLTANFLHLAWTGLLGLAFFQMLRNPRQRWEEFLATFVGVVLIHGIYDSLLDIPELSEHSVLSLVVIYAVAHYFFRKTGELRDAGHPALSPLAVFLIGTALLIGTVLNYTAWYEGFYASLSSVGFAVLSVALVAFVFINQFKED